MHRLLGNTTTVAYMGLKSSSSALYAACLDCDGERMGSEKQALIAYNASTTGPDLNLTVRSLWDTLSAQLTQLLDSSIRF